MVPRSQSRLGSQHLRRRHLLPRPLNLVAFDDSIERDTKEADSLESASFLLRLSDAVIPSERSDERFARVPIRSGRGICFCRGAFLTSVLRSAWRRHSLCSAGPQPCIFFRADLVRTQANHRRLLTAVEVAAYRVAHHFPQLLNVLSLGENGISQRARLVPALRRFFHRKNDFLLCHS